MNKSTLYEHIRNVSRSQPFGPAVAPTGDILGFEECTGTTQAAWMNLPVVEAIHVLDRLLFSVEIAEQYTSSSEETKTHKELGVVRLQAIHRDGDWIEDLLEHHARNYTAGQFNHSRFFKLIGGRSTLRKEHNEAIVDQSSLAEADIASIVCQTFPGIGAEIISAEAPTTRVVCGWVRPVYVFLAIARMGTHERLFLRREHQSLLVMVAHAHDLDKAVDIKLENIENSGTRGIYTQAYTATQSTSENCKIVLMGHPMLYRFGYARGTSLYVSGWRSVEPARIQAILSLHAPFVSKITQGHLVYETVALSRFTTDEMDLFLNHRHNLRINIPPVTDIVVGMVRSFAPSFMSRLLFGEHILLEDETHYGEVVWTDGKHKSLDFTRLFKPTFVWGNNETVAKVVEDDEYDMWKPIEGISGIPPVTGEIRITSHPNRGRRLLLTAHVGEPVGEAGLDPEDPANYPTLSALSRILFKLRSIGIHHHDVHGHNVLRNGDDVFVVDFGRAVWAKDCLEPEDCPDTQFLIEATRAG